MNSRWIIAGTLVLCCFCVPFEASATTVLETAKARADAWFHSYLAWSIANYVIGLASVVLAVLAGANKSYSAETKAKLSLFAAVAAAVLTFVTPSSHAKAFHVAWQGLDSKLRKFDEQPPSATQAEVNAAIDAGEDLLKD